MVKPSKYLQVSAIVLAAVLENKPARGDGDVREVLSCREELMTVTMLDQPAYSCCEWLVVFDYHGQIFNYGDHRAR